MIRRSFLIFVAGALLGLCAGCVVGWQGMPIASVTPTVGVVLTYPPATNVHLHEAAP